MANAATAADHVTLNQGEGGAVIATDYVNSNTDFGYGSGIGNAHFQVVKLSTGGPGEYALLSNAAPAPVRVWQIGNTDVSNGFIAVRGNTVGDMAVPVSLSGATLTVSDITIIGGTIDQITAGVSADIRSIKAGITLSVVGVGGNNSVAVTGDVEIGKGVSADIRSMPLPTGMTAFTTSFKSDQLYSFKGYTFESGVKIKNYFSGLEGLTPGHSGPGGGLLCVGYTGALAAGASTGYLVSPGEEVFIEIKNLDKLLATSVAYDGSASLWVNMTILGT
jgi:hypothetical protein